MDARAFLKLDVAGAVVLVVMGHCHRGRELRVLGDSDRGSGRRAVDARSFRTGLDVPADNVAACRRQGKGGKRGKRFCIIDGLSTVLVELSSSPAGMTSADAT